MKIVIFGGTTEGRNLSARLAGEGADVIVSVASEYGAEEQGDAEGIRVFEGLKDEDGIRDMIRGSNLVVDATHPYAVQVTENIRRAADREGIERLRLIREESGDIPEGTRVLYAPNAAGAAKTAAESGCNVLLTTGSKDLPVYAAAIDPEKLFPRVLPLGSSITACEEAGIPHRNIIAVQGPFSEELNRVVIRDFEIGVLVTKESGKTGGFEEKILACRACGIPAVVIRRPEEEGLSYDEVLRICREKMR